MMMIIILTWCELKRKKKKKVGGDNSGSIMNTNSARVTDDSVSRVSDVNVFTQTLDTKTSSNDLTKSVSERVKKRG